MFLVICIQSNTSVSCIYIYIKLNLYKYILAYYFMDLHTDSLDQEVDMNVKNACYENMNVIRGHFMKVTIT